MLLFSIVFITLCILSFMLKIKKKDNSISYKIAEFMQKEYPLIITLISMSILYNYGYVVMNYGSITGNVILEFLWNKLNKIKILISIKVSLIFDSLLNNDILKIIIILYFIKKFILNVSTFNYLKEFTQNIKEFSYKDLIVRLQEVNKRSDQEIEEIKNKEQKGTLKEEEAREAINKITRKKELGALMVDNHLIVNYLYQVIKYESPCIIIPINNIPRKVKLSDLQKIFSYESDRNSIKITGLNQDNEDLIIEVFNELLNEEVITCSES